MIEIDEKQRIIQIIRLYEQAYSGSNRIMLSR